MSQSHVLQARLRTDFGKKLKTIRKNGNIPANVYGKNIEATSVWLELKEFTTLLAHSSESTLIDLKIDSESKSRPVIIRDIQHVATKGSIQHVDLQQVNLKEKIQVTVAVTYTGESDAATKGIAILQTPIEEIEIECLPTEIPETIEVDVSTLIEVGDNIKVSDIKLSDKIEIITDPETVLATLTEPAPEEAEAAPVTEEELVAAAQTASGAKDDGEEPTEDK